MKKETFDSIIKKNLVEEYGKDQFGYKIIEKNTERNYENYYTEAAFNDFLETMASPKYKKYYESYAEGKGSELKRQKGRYGEMPPKMASVASSSRFCYLALRNGTDALGFKGSVEFEKGCAINGITGIAPQLDAFIPEKDIYVEAKCHEIFDSHKAKLKIKYWDLFYRENNEFGFDAKNKKSEEYFEIPLSCFGIKKDYIRFDIKQFLCHLIGIASQKGANNSKSLMYLFFKPQTDNEEQQKELDAIFNELAEEIKVIFESEPVRKFTEKNNIKLCAIAEHAKTMCALSTENMIALV